VDFIYLGRNSNCEDGFDYLSRYKGVECESAPKGEGYRGDWKGVYRYIKGENWDSSSCGNTCLTKRLYNQDECYLSCMQPIEAYEFINPFTRDVFKSELVAKKLYLHKSRIIDEGEIMAIAKNYTYYPYGKRWYALWSLGTGLVHPPSMSCANEVVIDKTDVYKPKKL